MEIKLVSQWTRETFCTRQSARYWHPHTKALDFTSTAAARTRLCMSFEYTGSIFYSRCTLARSKRCFLRTIFFRFLLLSLVVSCVITDGKNKDVYTLYLCTALTVRINSGVYNMVMNSKNYVICFPRAR